MRDQAPDIAWMQYGKHLRGQQQTALAGCRKGTGTCPESAEGGRMEL
jgi:hypothetical protein